MLFRSLRSNIKVGLGSDVAGGNTISIFQEITRSIQISKMYWRYIDKSIKPLTFEEAFYMATIGGGEFFGRVGSFKPGYEFDCIVLDDKVEPHPQDIAIKEQLERAVYLSLDSKGIIDKYVKGTRIKL